MGAKQEIVASPVYECRIHKKSLLIQYNMANQSQHGQSGFQRSLCISQEMGVVEVRRLRPGFCHINQTRWRRSTMETDRSG